MYFLPLLFAIGTLLSVVAAADEARAIFSGSSRRPFPWTPSKARTHALEINDARFGPVNISYFVINNQAIVDGDVIYGSVEHLLSVFVNPKGILASGLRPLAKRAHSITRYFSTTKPWPNAKISYKYASAATEGRLRPTVDEAISRWRRRAPYLQFLQLSNNESDVAGVVTFWDELCSGCSSHLGFTSQAGGGGMRVNLQSGCAGTWDACGPDIAVHEIGHLLGTSLSFFSGSSIDSRLSGLHHEHQRADRNSFVQFNCTALDPRCPDGSSLASGQTCCDVTAPKLAPHIPPGCCAMIHNFDIHRGIAFDASGAYDVNSVMHYEPGAFALPGHTTLVPSAVSRTALRPHLPSDPSDGDVERICQLYPGPCAH